MGANDADHGKPKAMGVNLHFIVLAAIVARAPLAGGEAPWSFAEEAPWTVMIYGGVDSSAEKYIMPQLAGLAKASRRGLAGHVVLLMDRIEGADNDRRILGENFADTRLFRLAKGAWERVSGGDEFPEITATSTYEANTGDARTLRKFIRFAKNEFPARRYMLVLFGHGESRSVCPDVSSECADSGEFEDPLFTAEISEGLTHEEAVDVLWMDTCAFGGIENAYQYRPGPGRFHAKVMLSSPTLSLPAPMVRVLGESRIVACPEPGDDLVKTPAAFCKAAMTAISEGISKRTPGKHREIPESWACYDLSRAEAAKESVDRLAVALAEGSGREVVENIRGWSNREQRPSGRADAPTLSLNYMFPIDPTRWVSSAHFDLYELARRVREDGRSSDPLRDAAREVMWNVDALVLDSVATEEFTDFRPGRHGIYIVFPGGETDIAGEPAWAFFRWYHPFDQRTLQTAFGNYAWCRDGATPGNERVENWFELLDSWLDTPDQIGGLNSYRW